MGGRVELVSRLLVPANRRVDLIQPGCQFTASCLETCCRGERLAPYFKKIDLTETYFANLNAYLDALLAHAQQEKALQPNEVNRHYGRTALESFNAQFAKSVDAARDNAIETEGRNGAAKAQGLAALYVTGCPFRVLLFMLPDPGSLSGSRSTPGNWPGSLKLSPLVA